MMIFGISIVHADLIVPSRHTNLCNNIEKLSKFYEYVASPLREIIAVLLFLFVVLGLILLIFRNIKNKNCSNNSIKILEKIFFKTNIVLSLISICLLKLIILFDIESNPISYVDEREAIAKYIIIVAFIIYAIIMSVFTIISIKNKNKKVKYITATCLTIILLLLCFIEFNSTNIVCYTYDENYHNYLNNL